MKKGLLLCAGFLAIVFAVVHLFFWKMLDWNEQLRLLAPENRGTMMMLNIAVVYYLLASAGFTFHLARASRHGALEKALLLFFGGFYLVRIGFGAPVYGVNAEELFIWALCLIAALCYLLPLKMRDAA